MHTLYISLGSNLGDRRAAIDQAVRLIGQRVGEVQAVSRYMENEAVGFSSSHLFLNACARVRTSLSPRQCLEATQEIERELGRTSKSIDGAYHDRCIDIDLLTYDDLVMEEPGLTLPHPRMRERSFVMLPLSEIT